MAFQSGQEIAVDGVPQSCGSIKTAGRQNLAVGGKLSGVDTRAVERRRAAQRDAITAERAAMRAAQHAAELAHHATERAHDAAVRQGAQRLRTALAAVTEAKPIERGFTHGLRQTRTGCRADEDGLLAEFRRRRARLEIREAS